MKELQFSVVVLMTLMCSALIVLLPKQIKYDRVINRSRWLMVAALSLLGVQFLIQYIFQFRTMGVTQAVLVNLIFFVPASALMSMTVLNLQRQGRLGTFEKWGWVVAWVVVVAILAIAVLTDGHPLEQVSSSVLWADIWASIVYAVMQTWYSILQMKELERMRVVMENYFDRERSGLVQWMMHSIGITSLMALLVPLLIFSPNTVLIVYALLFFWGIFMMWFCFMRYFTSNAMNRVREAEEYAEACNKERQQTQAAGEQYGNRLSPNAMQHVEKAVERWLATGDYLTVGITSPQVADAMQVPRYQLAAWVKASGYNTFTRWITCLRIKEAERVLKEHPDWTSDAVADHCGFNRAHFQKIFKKETGIALT